MIRGDTHGPPIVVLVGISQVMDCSISYAWQCWDVECKDWVLGASVSRAAILSACILSTWINKGWVSHPQECPALWQSKRPSDSPSLNLAMEDKDSASAKGNYRDSVDQTWYARILFIGCRKCWLVSSQRYRWGGSVLFP